MLLILLRITKIGLRIKNKVCVFDWKGQCFFIFVSEGNLDFKSVDCLTAPASQDKPSERAVFPLYIKHLTESV